MSDTPDIYHLFMSDTPDILGASVKHSDTGVVAKVIAVTRFLRSTTRLFIQWTKADGGIQELWVDITDVEVSAYRDTPIKPEDEPF